MARRSSRRHRKPSATTDTSPDDGRRTEPEKAASASSTYAQRLPRGWFRLYVVPVVAFLLGSAPSWYPIAVELLRPAFTATLGSSICSANGNIVLRLPPGADPSAVAKFRGDSNANLAVHITLTNTSDMAREIRGYRLEIDTGQGWQSMLNLAVLNPYDIALPFLSKKDRCWDLSEESFDIRARSTVVEPGHSIRGWAFFDWNRATVECNLVKRTRLSVLDGTGVTTKITQVGLIPADSELSLLGGGGMRVVECGSP